MEDVEREFEELHQQKAEIEAKIVEKQRHIEEVVQGKMKTLLVTLLKKEETVGFKLRKVMGTSHDVHNYEFTASFRHLGVTASEVAPLLKEIALLVSRCPNDVFHDTGIMDFESQKDFIDWGEQCQ